MFKTTYSARDVHVQSVPILYTVDYILKDPAEMARLKIKAVPRSVPGHR